MLDEEELKDAILLVFANKQDAKGAATAQQVCLSRFLSTVYYPIDIRSIGFNFN